MDSISNWDPSSSDENVDKLLDTKINEIITKINEIVTWINSQ